MIGTVVIAGAFGAGTLGAVKYREEKRKREYPWTVAAERMGVYPLVRRKRENRLVATGKAALNKLKELPFFGADRGQQQLAARTSGGEEAQISVKEQEANRLLAISGGLFVMATAGLWVPALNMLCLPTAIYLVRPYFKEGVSLLRNEKRIGLAVIDLLWGSAMLVTGHYVALSLFCGLVYFAAS